MNRRSSVEKPSSRGLDCLVQCLHRYVELNTERFETRQEGGGPTRVVTFVVAKGKPEGEDRILRKI